MIAADDQLNWYYDQLAGLEPETTPGEPKAGFYLLRRRIVRPNRDPNRRPGDARNKVTTVHVPVEIWHDGGWNMKITHDGAEEYWRDPDFIDEQFSRCCRNAITRTEYERLCNETYMQS
jgi:hypothetical protein